MSATVSVDSSCQTSSKSSFSIGVPATSSDPNLLQLIEALLKADYTADTTLSNLILVISEPTREQSEELRRMAKQNSKLLVIEEPERRGKWEAINRIFDNAKGEYLVLVNGDAFPFKGSIERLMEEITSDPKLAIVSSYPVLDTNASVVHDIARIFWDAHNEAYARFSISGKNNHCSDELMAVRLSVVGRLPPGTVNDGAFMAGLASISGYEVRFCPGSFVGVKVPDRMGDLLRQRRRIIFGHIQVWKTLGRAPRTMESTAVSNPVEALSILATVVRRTPRLILVLPLAVVEEGVSAVLAFYDNLVRSKRHMVWDRYISHG